MKGIIHSCRKRFRKNITAILAVCVLWGLGLVLGRYMAGISGVPPILVMRLAAGTSPSLILQLLGQLTPLLLTFGAASCRCYRAMDLLVVWESFAFGYSTFLCFQAFRSAGWLVYRILFFAECISVMVLLYAWLNIAKNRNYLTGKRVICFSCILCLAVLFDYFVFAKFLLSVLT